MKRHLLLLALCLGANLGSATAQDRVEILNADRVEGRQTPDGFLRRLNGNVRLRSDDVTVEADSALHWVDRNRLEAFGRIRITTDEETLTARWLEYATNTRIGRVWGGVVILRDSTELTSASAVYDFDLETATFTEPLILTDPDGTLRADAGLYFSKTDSAAFRGNVQLADSTYYLEADSLFSDRKAGFHRLHGRVFLHDKTENTRISGGYVEADSSGRRLIRFDALVERIDSAGTDTTYLQAADILILKEGDHNRITATGDVRNWALQSAARADTLFVFEADSTTWLRGNPIAWSDDIQLSGGRIDLHFADDQLARILALGAPSAAQPDSATGRLHQMKADTLDIRFHEGDIHQLLAAPNAHILYHSLDDEDRPDGALELRAAQVMLAFEEGDVADVAATRDIQGEYLAEDPALAEKRLEGVAWNPELRPQRPLQRPMPRLISD